MALYRYVKETTEKKSGVPRIVSLGFIGLGLGLLIWTVWPIIAFSTIAQQLFVQTITPVSEDTIRLNSLVAANSNDVVDYSNPNIWFPTHPQKKGVTPANTYSVSIPKLKIENAIVTVAGDDLSESLVHYGGTPFPGQYGNTVIFGHSTLPQFYNPKSYKTIFSLLPTLTRGDTISVTYDDVKYTYVVYDMVVVEPTDLTPLEQRFDDSYLTLVTCVPPGTYWKRLNVKARLEKEV
jgi:sortase A